MRTIYLSYYSIYHSIYMDIIIIWIYHIQIMSKYPDIYDKDFYSAINKIYSKYRIPQDNRSIEEYCKPTKFTLQKPQEFLGEFISPDTPYKSVLVYHRIGAGKTCAAIQISEKWKKTRRVVFVLPASLKGNLRGELRSLCAGNEYLKPIERKKLNRLNPNDPEYIDLIRISDERIDKYYSIYSYNKFIELAKNNQIVLKNSILIIDEIQNMVSEKGSYYMELKRLIENSPKDLRIVLLSATPMFDRPTEIALTINLLRPSKELPIGREFTNTFITKKISGDDYLYNVKNMDKFKKMIRGYVSYYRGAPSYTFPEMKIRYIECEMSEFQYSVYRTLLRNEDRDNSLYKEPDKDLLNATDLPNNFYIGTRFVSNIVFPNKKTGELGLNSLTPRKILKDLEKYSIKFSRIIKSVMHSTGKHFIYSSFKEHAGLKSLIIVLEAFGYKNYIKHGPGKKRFAVWSGDETNRTRDMIKEVFNRYDNLNGSKLKMVLGSPSIKEGVSFKAVRTVHVLEPYWNRARLEQVVGRASRFCSHQDLPEEQRVVKVYCYIAVHPDEPMTVDQYIKKLSGTKNKIIMQFEKAIKETAIDCRLNLNANQYDGNDKIICEI